jgi:hypothetical protein
LKHIKQAQLEHKNMDNTKFSVSVQRNCEILSIRPESEGHYAVTAKFTNATSECVAPLHIKGTPKNIGQVIQFLGKEFASRRLKDDDLENPLLEQFVFEIKGGKVIAQNLANGDQIIDQEAPEVTPDKVAEISLRFFKPQSALAMHSVPTIQRVWAETNANWKLRTEDRIKQKISDLHTFVGHLAEQKGISREKIDKAIETLSASDKNLNEVLNSYRLQYFPELEAELRELQDCEECQKHFSLRD